MIDTLQTIVNEPTYTQMMLASTIGFIIPICILWGAAIITWLVAVWKMPSAGFPVVEQEKNRKRLEAYPYWVGSTLAFSFLSLVLTICFFVSIF